LPEIPKFKPKPVKKQESSDSEDEKPKRKVLDADAVLISKSQFNEDAQTKPTTDANNDKKKSRAEMRAKLMLPDNVLSKLDKVKASEKK
jgi:hypothetical protein